MKSGDHDIYFITGYHSEWQIAGTQKKCFKEQVNVKKECLSNKGKYNQVRYPWKKQS